MLDTYSDLGALEIRYRSDDGNLWFFSQTKKEVPFPLFFQEVWNFVRNINAIALDPQRTLKNFFQFLVFTLKTTTQGLVVENIQTMIEPEAIYVLLSIEDARQEIMAEITATGLKLTVHRQKNWCIYQ